MEHIKRSRGILFPLLAGVAMATLAAGCKEPTANKGDGAAGNAVTDNAVATNVDKAKPYTQEDIVIGEYGSFTGSTATFRQEHAQRHFDGRRRSQSKGGVLNKKIRVVDETLPAKPIRRRPVCCA